MWIKRRRIGPIVVYEITIRDLKVNVSLAMVERIVSRCSRNASLHREQIYSYVHEKLKCKLVNP